MRAAQHPAALATGLLTLLSAALHPAAGSAGSDPAADAASPLFAGDVPALLEQAAAAGIEHVYDGPWEHFVGGGVATFDCNGDRMPDLFVAGGANPAALYVNRSTAGQPLRFQLRPQRTTDLTGVIGAYPLDIDADGHRDLVVLRVGANKILKGGPDCSFAPMPVALGIEGGRGWSTAFAATFERDRSGPTLAFGNYVDRSAPGSPWGTCDDNLLYRPLEQTPLRYAEPIVLSPGHCALSMLFTDWNRSGTDALRITNDRHYHRDGEEQLWRLDAGQWPRRYTRADGWASLVIWGMGIAEADLDADGFPEYALSSMGDTKLQQLDLEQADGEPRPAYVDIAWPAGATAQRPYSGDDPRPSTGWHAGFADLNNDARLDLFIAKGNVEAMNDFASHDPDNLLLGRGNGRFHEVGEQAGLARDTRGRGASLTDLNADGLVDVVVVNRGAPLALFRNTGMRSARQPESPAATDHPVDAGVGADADAGADQLGATDVSEATGLTVHPLRPAGNWLAVELAQDGVNPDAIGARLSVQTGNHVQTRRLSVGGGHASGAIGFVHLGLGVAERATLRIQWPDGEWSAAFRLFANQHVIIRRGESHVMQWFPVGS